MFAKRKWHRKKCRCWKASVQDYKTFEAVMFFCCCSWNCIFIIWMFVFQLKKKKGKVRRFLNSFGFSLHNINFWHCFSLTTLDMWKEDIFLFLFFLCSPPFWNNTKICKARYSLIEEKSPPFMIIIGLLSLRLYSNSGIIHHQ